MSVRDVTPNLKPDPTPCACGCGTVARPRAKAWGDGLKHARGCPCHRCKGSRAGPRARKRENKIAKLTNGSREPMSGNLSGFDVRAGLWVVEETANVALVRGFRRWIESAQIRKKTERFMNLHGVAHAFVLSWDGKPRWVVTPFDDWAGQVKRESEDVV